jgi:Fic family protein
MSSPESNIHVLDSAYKPFPPFSEWAAHTSVDTTRWDRYKAAIEDRPEQTSAALKRAREIVKRAAAIDTGAIEGLYEVDRGFTFTIAFETAAWELELAKKGEDVRSLFEAQLHAYDYVLDLATKAEPISEAAIRRLHEVVCAAQDTYRVITVIGPQEQELVKGRYKVLPNHVRTRDGVDHSYAPVDVTPAEMARLVAEMRTENFLAAHPVIQAAYAHYGLVVIHPFADGNGRVARALASAFTYRAISMPIMILSEHKSAYLDALEAADRGRYQEFVDFMLLRVLDTMNLVIETFRGSNVPSPQEAAAALENLYVTKGGYAQDRVDKAGGELFQLLQNQFQTNILKHNGGSFRGNASSYQMSAARIELDSTHRLPSSPNRELNFLHIELSSAEPGYARVYRDYVVSVPVNAASDDDFQLLRVVEKRVMIDDEAPMGTEFAFSARVDELIPSPAGVLQIRASIFAERIIGEMLTELKPLAEKALRGNS